MKKRKVQKYYKIKKLNCICGECATQLYPPIVLRSKELNGITISNGKCDICKIKSVNIPLRDLWRCIDSKSRMWD